MKKTTIQLSDGRHLIYFDEHDDAVRATVDHRHLPPYAPHAELRHDPTLDEWVTVASHRQDRTFLPPTDECPLCPSTGDRLSEIPADAYDVVVFENRFPSFADGHGRCEVVCFTDDHDLSFSRLTPSRARTVIDAWADRTAELSLLPDVEQVFCFENRGEEIGVTLSHPHGQIYGYPFVAPVTSRMVGVARDHRERTGRDLFTAVLAAERDGDRLVVATDRWTAFVPAAARWPFEVHLYPNRKVPDIPALDDDERDELAVVYLDLLRRLDSVFDLPMPYIAAWHQAPVRVDRDLGYLHLRLFSARRAPGKLKYLAGSESAMGAFINDVAPERAAELLARRRRRPGVTRILAVADEEDDRLTPARLSAMRPDVVVACGDLRFDYLDFIVSATNVPLIYIPGNHDPDVGRRARWGMGIDGSGSGGEAGDGDRDRATLPRWCTSADGRVVRVGGLVAAGLGGSMRYNLGPNQYTEKEMNRRANALATRVRVRGGRLDLLLTHAAPLGLGDGEDLCHRGFACFNRLVERLSPRYLIHGHIHPYGHSHPDRTLAGTTVINAIPHRLIELGG